MTAATLVPSGVRFGGQRYLAGSVKGLEPTGFTFTCWTVMAKGPLLFLGDRDNDAVTLQIAIDGTSIEVDVNIGTVSANAPEFADGQPHHLAVSFEQRAGLSTATVTLYADGHQVSSQQIQMISDGSTPQTIPTEPVTIGARPHDPKQDDRSVPDQVLTSPLTDVRLYRRALTPEEVRRDADELVATPSSDLLLALPFTAPTYDVAAEAPIDQVSSGRGPMNTQVVPGRGGRYGWTSSFSGFPTGSRTFEFRVRAGASDGDTILSYADVSSSDHPNDGGTPWTVTLSGSTLRGYGPAIYGNLRDGAWHHVAIVIDAEQGKGWSYVDGVLSAEAPCDVTGTADNQPLLLGAQNPDDDHIFSGLLMDVSLWSTARTADQIAADAAGMPPADLVGLVAYWPLGSNRGLAAVGASTSGSLTFSDGPAPLPSESLSSGGQPMALELVAAGDGMTVPGIAVAALPSATPPPGSVECWVRPSGAGTLLDVTDSTAGRRLAAVTVEASGQLTVRMVGSGAPVDTTLPLPSPGFGEWHHVALSSNGSVTSVVVDGESAATIEVPLPDLGSANLTFGRASDVTSPPLPDDSPKQLTGSLAEVRAWRRALVLGEIRGGMHHALRGDEPGLIGRWGFERGLGRDRSPARRTAAIAPSTRVSADVVDLEPREGRYLVSQTKLVEDFDFPVAANGGSPSAPTPRNSYRVVISAYEVDGTPVSDLALTLDLQPEPGGPANASLLIDAADGTQTHVIANGTPVTLTTNLLGNLSVSLPAEDLVAPVLRVRAPFMEADHALLVFPDRHAHEILSSVTADELRGKARPGSPRGPRTPLVDDQHAASAEAVAAAIRSFMGAAHEQVPQSVNPVARSADLRLLSPLPRPTTRRYENAYVVPHTYGARSDTASGHAHDGGGRIARQVVPQATSSGTWELLSSATGLTHSTLSSNDGDQIWSDSTLTTADPLAALFHQQHTTKRGQPMSKRDLTAALLAADQQGRGRGFFDFFDAIVNAAKVVVHAIEVVIDEVGQVVKAVVVFIYDQAQNVTAAVLQTVYDAVGAVKGVLAKVAATVDKAIEFVKELFDWSDILDTQAVIKGQLEGVIPFVRNNLPSAQKAVTTLLSQVKQDAHNALEAVAGGFTGGLIRDYHGTAAYAPPTDVQTSYLKNMIGDHGAQATITQSGSGLTASPGSLADALATHAEGSAALNMLAGRQGELYAASDQVGGGFAAAAAAFTRVLEGLSDELFDLAIAAVPPVFAELDGALGNADALLNWRLEIPLVTRLYESVIVPGDSLTPYSLGALAGALPTTILYKLATGSSTGPFPQGHPPLPAPIWPFDADGKLPQQTSRDLPTPSRDFLLGTWGMGGSFLVLIAVSGVLGTIVKGLSAAQKLPGGARSGLARVSLAFAWLFQLSQLPLEGFRRLHYIHGPASSWIEVLTWFTQFLPVTMDTITTARPASATGAGALRDKVVGIYGLAHAIAFIALVCVENREDNPLDVDSGLKFLGNVASCVPEVDSLAELAPWVVVLDGISCAVWEGVSVGRFIMQMETERRFLPR
jgi:hypothetical protein